MINNVYKVPLIHNDGYYWLCWNKSTFLGISKSISCDIWFGTPFRQYNIVVQCYNLLLNIKKHFRCCVACQLAQSPVLLISWHIVHCLRLSIHLWVENLCNKFCFVLKVILCKDLFTHRSIITAIWVNIAQ